MDTPSPSSSTTSNDVPSHPLPRGDTTEDVTDVSTDMERGGRNNSIMIADDGNPSANDAQKAPTLAIPAASACANPADPPPLQQRTSSLTLDVPVVRLELDSITYAPFTSAVVAAAATASPSVQAKTKAKTKRKTVFTTNTMSSRKTRTRTRVLDQISTRIDPYQLTAWMGPSGSGKTSLLSVTADLVPKGDVTHGSIRVNGEVGHIPKRLVGVVWQDDLLLSNLTVHENVYYCARLKTPQGTPDAEVVQLVHDTLHELGLIHVQHSLVGNPLTGPRGISGGERKRVSVACELVLKPSVLLLDEPTSGLDATTAQSLILSLKQLASKGRSIAVVIHQPRTTIYNMFDHLLLLSKGHVVYDGASTRARAFLESCPTVSPLPHETGIADWMMDIITEDERARPEGESKGALSRHWEACQAQSVDGVCCEATDSASSLASNSNHNKHMSTLQELNAAPKYSLGYRRQLTLLTARTLKQQRGERLTATAAILQLAYVFFTSLFWWRLPDNTQWIFSRNSLLFFMIIAQANGIVISAVTVFQRERALLSRERAKKMYGVASFFISKSVSDLTTNVFFPLLYTMIMYWTANLRPTPAAYFQYILAFYVTYSTAQSMGLFLSIAIQQTQISLILAPPITLFFMILGGFYIPFPNLNPAVYWLSWVSFARYGYSALVINEYAGRTIPCAATTTITDTQDAQETGTGISLGDDDMCPLPGASILQALGINNGVAGNFWFNIGMMMVLQLFFRFGAYVRLRHMKK